MWTDWIWNPGPLARKSDMLPAVPRGPALFGPIHKQNIYTQSSIECNSRIL